MGQLIKLQDYISRYEVDMFRYPSQYVRLKKQQWNKWEMMWEEGIYNLEEPLKEQKYEEIKKRNTFKRIKGLFNREQPMQEIKNSEEDIPDEFEFTLSLSYLPDTKEELKQIFLDQLLKFQMKWASSTIYERSSIDKKYFRDDKLKDFLQRFPDTFLFLYEPVFMLKKAPIEMEVLLISPTEVWCLSFLDEEKDAVYIGSNEHFWIKRSHKAEKKILNPLISLNRMEKIVRQLLTMHQIEIPIKKGLICRNGYIDYLNGPVDVELLEKREYPKWFKRQRNLHSPLKHTQLKAAKTLLDYCQTNCAKRPEWMEENEDLFINGEMDI